ncbi:MAG: hypothetical protein K1X89_01250 [Myxococcaceae bacterium]|nr:hypothetical protein [Myxococcaceae bacterium]
MRRATLAAALLLAACPKAASTADAGADAAVEVSPVELCERLAHARCDVLSRCYAAYQRTSGDECFTAEQARCFTQTGPMQSAFDGRRVHVDAARLSVCEQRMRTSSCPPSFPPGYPLAVAVPFSDCDVHTGLIAGAVASGELCELGEECTAGTTCIKPGGVCKGTCSSWPKEGEPCGFGCAPGLICDDQGTSGTSDDRCHAPRGLDEPCASSAACQADLVCTDAHCRPRARLGESCLFDPERLSTCEPGLACDVAPFVADARGTCVAPSPLNGKCAFHWSCAPGLVCADLDYELYPMQSPGTGFCRAPADPDTFCSATAYQRFVGDQCKAGQGCALDEKKCRPLPKLGEACTPSAASCVGAEVYCKPNGSGDTGTCTGPAGLGERCVFEVDAQRKVTLPCASGACDEVSTQTCRPPSKVLGSECSSDGECLSGRCAVQQDRSQRCASPC